MVLHHAVIVAGHGPCADVGELTHMGIANIGQMANLDAFIQHGIFDFDKVANVDIFGQLRPRPQAGKGANSCAARDVAAF